MKKDKKVKVKLKPKKEIKYPAAEIVQSACLEDYKRCLESYDKIYEKVNIALAFCGIVLLVILSSFDFTVISKISLTTSKLELFSIILYLICSVVSIICIVWAVIKLLWLMRSRDITVFNSVASRNEQIYFLSPDEASLWLIDNYTYATNEIRAINETKQKEYNAVIIKIVISLLSYAIVIIINKGF